jgi:putative transposase
MSNPGGRGRRSIRLPGYDYSQPGYYFVTICSYRRRAVFGEIKDGGLVLSEEGVIVREAWSRTEMLRSEIELDEFVIMPNHLHGIVIITKQQSDLQVGAQGPAPLQCHSPRAPSQRQARSLGSLVGRFKGSVTRQVRTLRSDPGFRVWQRNYYERVIRNEREMITIQHYILENPLRWTQDQYYCEQDLSG